jgi:hypothetical protein
VASRRARVATAHPQEQRTPGASAKGCRPVRRLHGSGDIVVEVVSAAQRAADALHLQLAGGDLPGGLTDSARAVQRGLVTAQHPLEDRGGTLLGLRRAAAQANQAQRALLAGRERTQVGAHVAQLQALREALPLVGVGGAEAVGAMEVQVGGAAGLAVLVDQRGRVELGVDHHGVRRGVPEQRLDDVDRRVVVQVLRGEHPSAVVRAQYKLTAVGPIYWRSLRQ